jgi:hypothetical protein
MKNSFKLGQGLAWAAWLIFVASLFMPVETNSLAGPCSWPCTQPFVDYGWQNASFFVLDLIVFPLKLLEVIYSAAFDPLTLRRVLESTLIIGMYCIIGLGEILIVLAPLWPARIKKTGWQRVHLWALILSALSALAYGLFPNLRLGLEVLSGYYVWVLSFVLMGGASVLLSIKKEAIISIEEGQVRSGQPGTDHS